MQRCLPFLAEGLTSLFKKDGAAFNRSCVPIGR